MKRWKKVFDWAYWIVLIGLIVYWVLPSFIPVGPSLAPESQVRLLNGSNRVLSNSGEKLVLVFWATWCPPCKVELARINRLVESNPALAEKVVAISLGEDLKTVNAAALERGYRFQVAYDESSSLGAKYEIQSTPTVVLKDIENKITWRSSGISPSLEVRINSFFD